MPVDAERERKKEETQKWSGGSKKERERLARVRDTGKKLIGNYLRARYRGKKKEEKKIVFFDYSSNIRANCIYTVFKLDIYAHVYNYFANRIIVFRDVYFT